MMMTRFLTISAAAAAALAAASFAQAQQAYPVPQGSVYPAPPYPPGEYRRGMPDFDSLEDEEALSPPGPSAPILSPEDPRYARAAPTGPILSPDDPRYARGVPTGQIMSPEDPRYGRPAGPPPVIYSERPPGPPQSYPGVYSDPNVPRPPGAVGVPQTGTTGSVQPPPPIGADGRPLAIAGLPPEEQPDVAPVQLPPNLRRQEVQLATKEPAGTIIVDTPNTYLYYVLGSGRAIRYGVRVGRDGFTWAGVQKISRKAEWPDWHPPTEMIERQPYLPRFMAGGPGNPLGARAMYLGNTVYRIHGTNQPSTIGKFVSSGCIGMLNEDVTDLFDRVKTGTRVVVWPGGPPPGTATASAQPMPGRSPGGAAPAPSQMSTGPAPGGQPTAPPPLPPPVTVR
jgi:lipoprotein-anchoring transpeptidase ErfK/SrfK